VVKTEQIGYKIFPTKKILLENNIHNEVELRIYHHITENAQSLYGFTTIDELNLFEKLISVSGIGPKTAIGAFGVAEASDIRSAIINGDSSILKQVSGIGTKTAERVVLELKNKLSGLVGFDTKTSTELMSVSDSLEALTSLGYSEQEARQALQKVPAHIMTAEEKVKIALQFLQKN